MYNWKWEHAVQNICEIYGEAFDDSWWPDDDNGTVV